MANPTIQPDTNTNMYAVTGITVNGSGNAVVRLGDMSLWDTVANKYVAIEQTNLVGQNQ